MTGKFKKRGKQMKFEVQEAEASIQATATLYQLVRSQLLHLPATEHGVRPNGEWTKKEILGHCCDGTAANLQRVVRAQYEESPPRSVYNQAEWVRIQNYSLYDWPDLVDYWYLGNKHILHIYKNMPLPAWSSRIVWGSEERSALWFFHHHFVRHTLGHLEEVLLEPIVIPDTIPQFDMAGNKIILPEV
jgi:hypothetical protein